MKGGTVSAVSHSYWKKYRGTTRWRRGNRWVEVSIWTDTEEDEEGEGVTRAGKENKERTEGLGNLRGQTL